MIEVTVTTKDDRSGYNAKREKKFTIESPEIEAYIKMLHEQGWTNTHEAVVAVVE